MTISINLPRRDAAALWATLGVFVFLFAAKADGQVRVHSRSFGISPDIEVQFAGGTSKVNVADECLATETNVLQLVKPEDVSNSKTSEIASPTEKDVTDEPGEDHLPRKKVFKVLDTVEFERPPEAAWKPFEMFPRQSAFISPAEEENADDDDTASKPASEKFHWKPAIVQSIVIQGFQHSYAMLLQEKTRRALKGPFWKDYIESVRLTHGWDDGNKFFTNYIAHPMQGGMTGFIFVQNHDRAKTQKFGESKQYWKDRFKAFVWSTAWSTNWEIGPISQSSIGNVGLYGHMGYVDMVITPTVGTGWLLTEEALDRYIIRHIESKGMTVKLLSRTFLNPMRSVANMLRLKTPWYRDRPFGH